MPSTNAWNASNCYVSKFFPTQRFFIKNPRTNFSQNCGGDGDMLGCQAFNMTFSIVPLFTLQLMLLSFFASEDIPPLHSSYNLSTIVLLQDIEM